MSPDDMRILRGDSWGARLREALVPQSLEIRPWMEQNTLLLKSDTYSQVGLLQLQGRTCYLKLLVGKSRLQRVLFRCGYGRGTRSFDAARELAAKGVTVPEPLACLVLPEGMLLLTEGVSGGRDLKALWAIEADIQRRGELLREAGKSLADLHLAGFSHGDFKWSNLLWSGEQFYLVDLDGVRKRGANSDSVARDIARFTLNAEELGVTAEIFEFFFTAYLAHSGKTRADVIRRVLPVLRNLRARHAQKYGQRGHRLLGEKVE